MKNSAFLVLLCLILITAFTGCISKRVDLPPEMVVTLTDENSTVFEDDKNWFTLRVPNGIDFELKQEEDGARLYQFTEPGSEPPTKMYIEENTMAVEAAISLLVGEEVIKEVGREDINIGGYEGKKITVQVSTIPSEYPYYFVNTGPHTYVFSLRVGQAWDLFQSVIDSFEVIDQADDSADEGVEGGDEVAQLEAES